MHCFFIDKETTLDTRFIPLPEGFHKQNKSLLITANEDKLFMPTKEGYRDYLSSLKQRRQDYIERHNLHRAQDYLAYLGEDPNDPTLIRGGELSALGEQLIQNVDHFLAQEFKRYRFKEYCEIAAEHVNLFIDRPVLKVWAYLSLNKLQTYSCCGWGSGGENLYHQGVRYYYGVSFLYQGEKYRAALLDDEIKLFKQGEIYVTQGGEKSHWHPMSDPEVEATLGLKTSHILPLNEEDLIYIHPQSPEANEVLLQTIDAVKTYMEEQKRQDPILQHGF